MEVLLWVTSRYGEALATRCSHHRGRNSLDKNTKFISVAETMQALCLSFFFVCFVFVNEQCSLSVLLPVDLALQAFK